MKILISNHWLKKIGGSETFTYTLVKAAKEFGAQVTLFTHHPGAISRKIQKDFGVEMLTNQNSFDLILANHNPTVEHLHPMQLGHIIQTCHGVVPKLEQPSPLANQFVAVSNEVKQNIIARTKRKDVKLILNMIDTQRFIPKKPANPTPKTILSLSHSQPLNDVLLRQCFAMGMELITLNKYKNPVWEVQKHINQADIVVTLGRGALETMCCARTPLVLDHRPYQPFFADGLVTPENVTDIAQNNFSGRRFRLKGDIPSLFAREVQKYNPQNTLKLFAWAHKQADYKTQFTKYIQLWQNK